MDKSEAERTLDEAGMKEIANVIGSIDPKSWQKIFREIRDNPEVTLKVAWGYGSYCNSLPG